MDLLGSLNPPQREAAEHVDGPLLILAGAGSGKTRVITHRVAHLVIEKGVHPEQILAVTFTNKAAGEMRERVDELLKEHGAPEASAGVTISTFHSLGARLLRRHADQVGLTWSFSIYDEADQAKMIRELMDRAEMPRDRSQARRLRGYIERMKNRGATPDRAHEGAFSQEDEENAYFYEDYQRALRRANCVDFGDLIMAPLELFRANPALAAMYSRQWRYIMVDEFQDTNPAQYELLAHLTAEHHNLAVVGDDDQAIYRWRGATVANILGFEGEFPKARVIKLEQNYRSTQVILDAADDVIRHNPSRRDKKLWTDKEGGDPISVFTASDDREEAQYVAETIRTGLSSGALEADGVAIFFRANAQGRLFEEQLRYAGIDYQIVGGMSFYQRAEIKDVLAYLKIALNPVNDVDILRVINTPSRSVGDATAAKLMAGAQVTGIGTLFGAIRYVTGADMTFEGELALIEPAPATSDEDDALLALEKIGGAQTNGLRDFHDTIQSLRDDLMHYDSLAEILRQFIERLNYFDYLDSKFEAESEDKKRNVSELVNAIEEFERDWMEDAGGEEVFKGADLLAESESALSGSVAVYKLRAFLDQSALIQAGSKSEADEDEELLGGRVTLMTVHGSKGLEFDTVFLVGMEDEVFPSIRDKTDPEEEHEERRLAYVAITRAREKLYVTNAKRRRVYGQFKDTSPSRFLLDIDPGRLEVDPKSTTRAIDWRPKRRVARAKPLTDEERYFSDGGPDYAFDQSGGGEEEQGAAGGWDEFAQVAPDEQGWSPGGEEEDAEEGAAELVGKTVTHTRFGVGRVESVSGSGDKAVVGVKFAGAGRKKIMRRFLKVLG
jgi:DNA helicase-2/ATP-dependent DNA helicase PcrA